MADPLRNLKFLPWVSLIQVSTLITCLVVVLDVLLALGYQQFFFLRRTIKLLYLPPLGIIVSFAVAVGIGAIAVYVLETYYRQVIINAASLWALILCLAIALLLKSLLPLPGLLINLNEMSLIAILLGVFWKGRPYWR